MPNNCSFLSTITDGPSDKFKNYSYRCVLVNLTFLYDSLVANGRATVKSVHVTL